MERIKTDIAGLDEVLCGGIPEYATVLVTGVPGTGKTILCQNILFNVSKNTGRKTIYFSTISEPQIKVLRYQQQFSTSGLFDGDMVTKHGISYVADNIIFFKYFEADFKFRRLVGVLKMRGSGHRTEMLEFIVDEKGPAVLDRPFS